MQRPVSTTSNARIAWGGDRYVISDGKSTQYYIDLQKEKARKEKERKQNQTSVSVRRNHEFYSSAWNSRKQLEQKIPVRSTIKEASRDCVQEM